MTDTLIGYALSNIRNQFSTNNELGVEISPSLVELKELSYLDLSMNSFGGIKVPEFIGRLTELRYLSLSGASFSGSVTSFLGNLLNLQVLDLSFYSEKPAENDLEWLRGLSFLEHLSFGGLDLSKVADSWLHTVNSHSPSLPELDLPECQLLDLLSSLPSLSLLFWSTEEKLGEIMQFEDFDPLLTASAATLLILSMPYLNANFNELSGNLPV
ncbi:hypothetical protein FXO37_09631 [Capsicum annuum]|nr:hypothetical protein FXO37_09631 [Capsicum annuum]